MRQIFRFFLLLLALEGFALKGFAECCGNVVSSGTVSNVWYWQRTDGSKFVDIHYDLSGDAGSLGTIALTLSLDGGTLFGTLPSGSLTGDIGAGISAGTNKIIRWDATKIGEARVDGSFRFAGRDFDSLETLKGRMRVTLLMDGAGGTFAPIPGGTYSLGNARGDGYSVPVDLPAWDASVTDAGSLAVKLKSYYMSVNDTTKAQWDAVRTWGLSNGYADLVVGGGPAPVNLTACVITNGSLTVSCASTARLINGMSLSGTGLANNATVVSVTSGTTFTMSVPPNASNSFGAISATSLDHPVHTVGWYDVVKWANAASEKDGRTPCYTVGGATYRTEKDRIGVDGLQNLSVVCNWSVDGYRLPTEAEWEVAARGTLTGMRFPLGDTISQSQANYVANIGYLYDNSRAVNGYNPAYAAVGVPAPYTSPVGSFIANGYGLNDMSGNVAQWCWDWYETRYAGGGTLTADPVGPTNGPGRVLRGGYWDGPAYYAQCFARCFARFGEAKNSRPSPAKTYYGFRLACGRSEGVGSGVLSLPVPLEIPPTTPDPQKSCLLDTTPPRWALLPPDITVYADTPAGKNVSYEAYLPPVPSYDLMPLEIKAPPYLTYSISSGTLFPIGVTPVTMTAKDYVGNVSTCTFNVIVLLPKASNVAFSQRKDGSGTVDICYDLVDTFKVALAGTFNMALAVSLDGGTTFSSLTSISGSVGAGVTGGSCKSIQWDAIKDYPNFGSSSVVMRVTRLLDGVGGGAFAPIPGGTYSVGNVVGDSDIIDAGTVSVTLSDYYMSVKDITKAQWDAVRTKALALPLPLSNRYKEEDLARGAGFASDHPVQSVSWYDVVKWANAASEVDGLTPCYKLCDKAGVVWVYRTGIESNVVCDWSANGYRLPTEAEWEVAARGGLIGKRFPLGDTISQSQANYFASISSSSYDLSRTVNNYNLNNITAGALVYSGTVGTAPVGRFVANGYGLNDMEGNVAQWCWDWSGVYSGGLDPRGALNGVQRAIRGGYWSGYASSARSSKRAFLNPSDLNNYTGFRLVRGRPFGVGSGMLSDVGILDTKPPTLNLHDIIVPATSENGAVVTFSGESATDNFGTPTTTYNPASGSLFSVGTQGSVTVSSTDGAGNLTKGTFKVTVLPFVKKVSNVRFSQLTNNSGDVEINYDLTGGTLTSTSSVALAVSLDGGTTYASLSSTFLNTGTIVATGPLYTPTGSLSTGTLVLGGDVGSGVTMGTDKCIHWNTKLNGAMLSGESFTGVLGGGTFSSLDNPLVKMRVTALLDSKSCGTFAPIPGGTYSIGNAIGDSDINDAKPVSVTLSDYYMSVNDTTKDQWNAVTLWGGTAGYTDLVAGGSGNFPVSGVTWYDAAKWANAASEKDGLTPCYKVGGEVYRTGISRGVVCDWDAIGYRLPTEAEWEVAARGTLSGKRFPLGDTISQSHANYFASVTSSVTESGTYDMSWAVNGYPAYLTFGGTASSVGSFVANGYGLNDMAGNVAQWCWDLYGTPIGGGTLTDPHGAQSGALRVQRGGGWRDKASVARVGSRGSYPPTFKSDNLGFRLALRSRLASQSDTGIGMGSMSKSVSGKVDNIAPDLLTVPSPQSVLATSASGAIVSFSGASSTTPGAIITYSPVSGSIFRIGVTPVTVTATDGAGNTTSKTFDVTVEPLRTLNVIVSSITAGTMSVSYDLYSPSHVAMAVSVDGGTTFLSVGSLTGDVSLPSYVGGGTLISAGTGKHIYWNAGSEWSSGSSSVTVRVTPLLDGVGGTFAPIPSGTYSIGNIIGDADIINSGTVSVRLSDYYMSVNDTTKAQWDAVRTWGLSNGYTDLPEGAGKGVNHPVQMVSWYDAVKWANAASEIEGLLPCYKVGIEVYRVGTDSTVLCDWSANGYRLPTEAEWEVAARGTLSGKRFPLADKLSQDQANYFASVASSVVGSGTYDTSWANEGYHQNYAKGGYPYTSPVGELFPANGYGLADMAGNVSQWCWDWYGLPIGGGAVSDPHGATVGSQRVLRGGNWNDYAAHARCAQRDYAVPTFADNSCGFRLARGRQLGTSVDPVLTGGTSVNVTPPALGAPQSGAGAGAVPAIGAMVNNSAASPAAKAGAIAQNVASLDPSIVGTFHGWIERNQSINKNLASSIQITTTSKGTYSGRLLTGATVLALRGSLIVEPTHPLQARVLCVLPKLGTLDVTLDSAGNLLSGTLTDSSSNVAAIHGWRNVWPTADGNAEAFKGMHTFYLQPRSVDDSVPQGSGFGSLIVNAKSGITFINVTLSDGAKFSSATILGPLGQTLLYGSLYTNLGSVAGQLLVAPSDNSITGNPTWLRPDLIGKVIDSSYQAGFGPVELDVAGGRYLVPKKGEFALGLASGANISLAGASSPKGAVAAAAANQVRVSALSSSTGAFSGSFMVQGATAADNRRANFYGQLVTTKDGTTKGYGYFLLPKLPVMGQPVTSSPKFSGSVLLNSAP